MLQVRELLPFAEALNFAVEEYAGNRGKIPPRRRLSKKVVYVATIEKVILTPTYMYMYTVIHINTCTCTVQTTQCCTHV